MPRRSSILSIAAVGIWVTGHGPCWSEESQPGPSEPSPPTAPIAGPTTPYSDLIAREAKASGLSPELIAAVIYIESGFSPAAVGSVGEIGLMQIRPETAAMLGFTGGLAELSEPETNIRLGVRYLAKAWQLAEGDLCRTLIKYRAGHGEERETFRSTRYCQRAQAYLKGTILTAYKPIISSSPALARPSMAASAATATARRGTPQASKRFWAAHEARVRLLKLAVRSKWARLAQSSAHN